MHSWWPAQHKGNCGPLTKEETQTDSPSMQPWQLCLTFAAAAASAASAASSACRHIHMHSFRDHAVIGIPAVSNHTHSFRPL